MDSKEVFTGEMTENNINTGADNTNKDATDHKDELNKAGGVSHKNSVELSVWIGKNKLIYSAWNL